ncbi:class I SAM-dependent methyltransferase [Chloroflexota bacterium]
MALRVLNQQAIAVSVSHVDLEGLVQLVNREKVTMNVNNINDTQDMAIDEKIEYLESKKRTRLDIEKVLSFLPLAPQRQVVADIGCGTGTFTLPLAHSLSKGRVYAIDIQEKMLEKVREKLVQQSIKNIETRLCGELEFPLEPGTMDGILLANVLHETPDPMPFIKVISTLVRPGGWVAILDWKKEKATKGPPFYKRLSPNKVQIISAEFGLYSNKIVPIWEDHYLVLLDKA